MINIVLVYDDLDYDADKGSLGEFFKGCAEDFKLLLKTHQHNLSELDSTFISDINLIAECTKVNSRNFLLVTYSHGYEDCLLHEYKEKKYVVSNNIISFKNSFFYTWSCYSGLQLGEELHKLGSVIFFGYTDEVIGIEQGGYMDIFIKCANEGMRLFLNGLSVEDSYYGMLDFYKKSVFELSKSRFDTIAASALGSNRRALIHYADGLENLTIQDFIL